MSLKILFVGGAGNISLPCVVEAVAAGHEVSIFNRGATAADLPPSVRAIRGDINDAAAYRALGKAGFDVVCQFIAFTPAQMAADIAAFSGGVGQYIFISSASVYEKPPRGFIITEKTPTVNPYWRYSQDKIACEAMLKAAKGLAWTIVRPSHTVRTMLPTMVNEGDAVAHRMLAGKPVIVAGDGATPWTLTRCADFAKPFVKLFGRDEALGEDFHITSDHAYSWDAIYRTIAAGLGVEADIVHAPTETLIRYLPEWEGPLMGDKTWTALFDNSKVKRVAGDFSCEKDLGEVLKEPIASAKARIEASGPKTSKHDATIDRIARDLRALGT
ncbi:MAG TPA: SDR family oxidoreductase [Roseiarcus sp.]|nr:SDR family oxidoreductase [Roseiarcus sp.]